MKVWNTEVWWFGSTHQLQRDSGIKVHGITRLGAAEKM